jgi:SH3-like domain-containing protein
LIFGITPFPWRPAACYPAKVPLIQASLTVLDQTAPAARAGSKIQPFSYQMGVTTQSVRAAFARVGTCLLALGIVTMLAGPAYCAGETPTGSVSGLQVPRFVSLKSDRVNVRSGPNKDQEVRWVYTRAGMPVEITAEFENWRRIRDWEGAEGWVYHSLLSGKRSAVVVPTLKDDMVPLYESRDVESAVAARLQSGVLGQIKSCNGTWCEFSGKNFSGWIKQERLWGAYPNEKVD